MIQPTSSAVALNTAPAITAAPTAIAATAATAIAVTATPPPIAPRNPPSSSTVTTTSSTIATAARPTAPTPPAGVPSTAGMIVFWSPFSVVITCQGIRMAPSFQNNSMASGPSGISWLVAVVTSESCGKRATQCIMPT